jgi:hypothetical protein
VKGEYVTEHEIRRLQSELNNFTRNHKALGFTPLRIDGQWGQLTQKRIREVKWFLGYSRDNMTVEVNEIFFQRMRFPNRVEPKWNQSKAAVQNARKRRLSRARWVAQNHFKSVLKSGVGRFDGKPVAKAGIPLLQWARQNGWHGQLNSGWRDPKYSQHLCFQICGAPSCPGRCAGLSSNHVGSLPTRFAMDVSDYVKFAELMRRCPLKPNVHNALGARDPVHFSPSGN